MAVYSIICTSPNHASRTGEPDYVDPLGSLELPDGESSGKALAGYLCPACKRGDYAESLPKMKKAKCKAVDKRTNELVDNGFEFPASSGAYFSLSQPSQAKILGADSARDDPAFSYPVVWNNLDDSGTISIPDSATLHGFFLTALGTVRARLDSGTTIKDQVRMAETVADVLAVVDDR